MFYKIYDIEQKNYLNEEILIKDNFLVISDIHGNLPALKIAFNFSRTKGITKFIALGDYIDYNQYEEEVLELILFNNDLITALRGNHEVMRQFDNKNLKKRKVELSQMVELACELPDQVIINLANQKSILLTHSNPKNDHFIYLDNTFIPTDQLEKDLENYLKKMPYDGFWFGHTHFPYYYSKNNEHVFNPGSLGNCRSFKNEISFALVDPFLLEISLFKMDIEPRNDINILSEPELVTKYKID